MSEPEYVVHALERDAGADLSEVVEGERVEEGHAAARLQDLLVRRREQAVRQTVPEKATAAQFTCHFVKHWCD